MCMPSLSHQTESLLKPNPATQLDLGPPFPVSLLIPSATIAYYPRYESCYRSNRGNINRQGRSVHSRLGTQSLMAGYMHNG